MVLHLLWTVPSYRLTNEAALYHSIAWRKRQFDGPCGPTGGCAHMRGTWTSGFWEAVVEACYQFSLAAEEWTARKQRVVLYFWIFTHLYAIKYALVVGWHLLWADAPLKRRQRCQSHAGVSLEALVGGSLECQWCWHHCHWAAMKNLPHERENDPDSRRQCICEHACVCEA